MNVSKYHYIINNYYYDNMNIVKSLSIMLLTEVKKYANYNIIIILYNYYYNIIDLYNNNYILYK